MPEERNGSILIVDDLKENLFVLNHVLKSNNYEVYLETNGRDAIQAAEENRPDLILLDLMMPDMDGFEVCQKLKEIEETSDIPIVFLTSNISVESNLKGLNLGAADYIFKPFNKNLLLKKVEQLLDNKRKLQDSLEYDPLTNLLVRESLYKSLKEKLIPNANSKDKLLAVMTFDLSRFKFINDTHGRKFGDEVLLAFSKRIKKHMSYNDLLARTGGDEFCLVVAELDDQVKFENLFADLLSTLAEPYSMKGKNLFIRCNVGVSFYPNDEEDAAALLQFSTRAMYNTKQTLGVEYTYYNKSLEEDTRTLAFIENELYAAYTRKDFTLYYQPQFNPTVNKYQGFETLIRWKHPKKGLIPPNDFIPVAENNGLIIDIGKWIIDEAFRFYMTHKKDWKYPYRLSINISPVQLWDKSFLPIIEDLTKKWGIDPSCVEYEITEGVMIEDKNEARKLLQSIRDIGSRIAIDDFGTGFSALSYLKFMPLDSLKLDRSFVLNTPHDKKDCAIVSSIITLAKNLDLEIVAEGAETIDQVSFLKSNSCELIQGYYYSPPLDSECFLEFLSKNK